MKLLLITNRVPWPLKDGGALAAYNFMKGYHDAGVELTLASLNTSKHFIDLKDIPEHFRKMADIHLSYIDNRVKILPAFLNLFGSGSYNIQRFVSHEFENLLTDLCREKSFDVVVFESLFVAPYLPVIRQHSGAVCILREHNIEFRIWESLARIEKNILKRGYLNLLARRLKKYELGILNEFDGLSAITETDRKGFRELGCTIPIEVFPFGIDADNLHADISVEPNLTVFHIGSMDWMPNQEAMKWFLKEVWAELHQEFPDLSFYLAGRNIPESFSAFHEKENVHVIGEVEDAYAFIRKNGILVVPLFSGSGIRVKILEGMAAGKCIVSTTLGAQGIDALDGEHILIADTALAFKEKIRHLLQNPEEIQRIGKNAHALAIERYDSRKIMQRLLNYYRELIQNKKK